MHTIALLTPHWGGGFWPVFPALWGLFWIAVVALAVTARRRGWWGPRRPQAAAPAAPTAGAEQILAERYARGEMSDDEYFEKMSVLRNASA
ncbi:SHOCT domain-containing protein [Actinomadura sp. ATCC 31491]|uniref:SHOCT domain-containing protein n=1 Tax=Actinomadura luzonensis TaxID=2805427 RepID=A0ABT0G8U1_9ACTN|nr:SHOCT domain-containing protein [Actinomadura luzonensis]MCK2221014.1 SHOCT domain-containing protein [Actinomadura luzonensis]